MGGSFARRQSSEGQLWRRQNIRKVVSCFFVHGEIVRRELSSGQSSEEQLSWGQLYGFNHPGSNFLCVRVCEYVRVCVWGGGEEDGVHLSGGQISSGSIILGVNCPRGNISGANHPGGGNCPSGNYPGGNFPREKMSRLRHGRIVKKDWQLISLFKNICHLVIMLTL